MTTTNPHQLREKVKPLPLKAKLLRPQKASLRNRHLVKRRNHLPARLPRQRARPHNQHIPNNLSADHLNERLDLRAFIHCGIKEVETMQPFTPVLDNGLDLDRGCSSRE